MNGVSTKCASTHLTLGTWENIDWNKCEVQVRKLQERIVKAQQQGRYSKVKSLQHILTTSLSAKLLAVKRVTSNKGKRTAGVDSVKWETSSSKLEAAQSLRRRGYHPLPLKRVYIEKSNGKKRPLGIPTMKDRAMQALYLMALEPISETMADKNSYGFRKKRGTQDAIQALHMLLCKWYSPQWILEGDIKGCFDHISHKWLIEHVPTDKQVLRKWLNCGVVFNKILSPTKEGTPQGGIISPTLANMTLDGLEALVEKANQKRYPGKSHRYCAKVHLVRYADDFVITADTKEILEALKPEISHFLAERGLILSEEKTQITHISEGFDFLGFNIRKYRNGVLLIKPSKKSQKKVVEKLHEVVFGNKSASQCVLIELLNPVIRGWSNYFKHHVAKKVFARTDHILTRQLMVWAYRRHKNKSKKWTIGKYFHRKGRKGWIFECNIKQKEEYKNFTLLKMKETPITRYIKVKKDANPFDPQWNEYFEKRDKSPKIRRLEG